MTLKSFCTRSISLQRPYLRLDTFLRHRRQICMTRSVSGSCVFGRRERLLMMSTVPNASQSGSVHETAGKGHRTGDEVGVLFVCLGNICRSPTAEAVFKSVAKNRQMEDRFRIDSCGTGGGSPDWYLEGGWSFHEGDPADNRMRRTASRRNITLISTSRPLRVSDLKTFDLFVAMDASNVEEMKTAIRHWSQRDPSLAAALDNIVLMTDYCKKPEFKSLGKVPDPYYGGRKGFEYVLDILTDACDGLLDSFTPQT